MVSHHWENNFENEMTMNVKIDIISQTSKTISRPQEIYTFKEIEKKSSGAIWF